MAASTIPEGTEWVGSVDFARFLAELLREHLPGGIYIEVDDEKDDTVYVISRGDRSAGIYVVTVQPGELRVYGDGT